jgi:ribose 5-phosphate isomerase B
MFIRGDLFHQSINMLPTIYIGNDHAGYEMKRELKKSLEQMRIKVIDVGSFNADSVDYPDLAYAVCTKVREEKGSLGILICGTGIGMAMTANKQSGIRAAMCTHETMARLARLHNDANVLCLGARIIGMELAKDIIKVFIETEFSGEDRHKKRIAKMDAP